MLNSSSDCRGTLVLGDAFSANVDVDGVDDDDDDNDKESLAAGCNGADIASTDGLVSKSFRFILVENGDFPHQIFVCSGSFERCSLY